MKTAKQIIDAINEFYRISIECPPGCFRNLEGMEDQLCLLESNYEFILDDSNERIPGNNGFGEFLFDNDYGTLGYCYGKLDEDAIQTRLPMKAPTDEEVEKNEGAGGILETISVQRTTIANGRLVLCQRLDFGLRSS